MARRDLLTDTERQMLFGVPRVREDLACNYMLGPRDLALVVASLKAGTVLPSAMLRKLAAYERQN